MMDRLGGPSRPTTLVLFDIDGTLLLSGGAGKRALNETFEELFGVAGGFDGTRSPAAPIRCCSTRRWRGTA